MGDRAGPSDDTQGSIPMFLLQNVAEPQKAATFQMEPNVEMAWWNHFSIAHLSEHSELWPMANKMQSKWSQKALTNLPFGLPR